MQAKDFESANLALQAPPSMDDEDVGTLPIMAGAHELPSGDAAPPDADGELPDDITESPS